MSNRKPYFVMMVGLPGSSKSTYAKQLAEETNAIICSSDAIREELCGDNIYDDDYEVDYRSIGDYKRIYSVMRQNKDAFMKLFSLFYYDLWD